MSEETLEASEADVRDAAIRLLARREHARRELVAKLRGRGFGAELIETVLDQLEGERLLSDARYAEVYVRSRIGSGHGPLRIRAELRERGIDEAFVERELAGQDPDWFALAARVRRRRFGDTVPEPFKERARQMRFLQYRGFDGEQIRAAMDGGFDPDEP